MIFLKEGVHELKVSMKIVVNSSKPAGKHKIICFQNKKVDNFGTLNRKLINSNWPT